MTILLVDFVSRKNERINERLYYHSPISHLLGILCNQQQRAESWTVEPALTQLPYLRFHQSFHRSLNRFDETDLLSHDDVVVVIHRESTMCQEPVKLCSLCLHA